MNCTHKPFGFPASNRVDAVDFIDGIDLGCIGTPYIGNDGVFVFSLCPTNGLGYLLKQVHDWGAAQTKRLSRKLQFQPLSAIIALHVAQEKNQFDTLLETRLPHGFQTVHVHEEIFLWEGEILHQ